MRQKYKQKTDQRYSLWILLHVFLMIIELYLTSTSLFLGMDAFSLQSLGILESEIESIVVEEEDYKNGIARIDKGTENDKAAHSHNKKEDAYLQYKLATTPEEEEDVFQNGSESAW